MAEETERKFKSIMDKLYQSVPLKSPPSCGKERSAPAKRKLWEIGFEKEGDTLAKRASREEEPAPCRPWDRGDLMRRLATFKAMTWFGKPKVIDPVSCARRGWKNIDVDTLSCESCRSRLLFPNPSSWNLQQVEKAAAVFSLKLESGHKQLCPWIDNICEESLAYFPPTPSLALISGFKERSSSLLQVSALPVISTAALELIKNPQFESFLKKGSELCYGVESLVPYDVSEREMSSLYHQAHMILSLCGWEPRPVPYIVETMVDHPSTVSVSAEGRNRGEDRDHPSSNLCYDPGSVLFECKLCGVRVGLWAFKTVPKPLRIFNLIESPDEISAESTQQKGPCQSLNLTIAGGPPPAKQDFKPRISLPIVSRHLRGVLEADDAKVEGKSQNQVLTLEKDNERMLPVPDKVVSDADVSACGQSPTLALEQENQRMLSVPNTAASDADISIRGQSPTLALEQENQRMLSVPDMVVGDADVSIQGHSHPSASEDCQFNGNAGAFGMVINDADVITPGQSQMTLSENCRIDGNGRASNTLIIDADISIQDQSPATLSEDLQLDGITLAYDALVDDADISIHGQKQSQTILSEDPQLHGNALASDVLVNDADINIHGESQNQAVLLEDQQIDGHNLAYDLLVNDVDVSIHGQSQTFLSENHQLDGNACASDMVLNDADIIIHGQRQILLLENPQVEGNTGASDVLVSDADVIIHGESQIFLSVDPQLDGSTSASDLLINDADVSNDGQGQSQTPLSVDPQLDGNSHSSDAVVNVADVIIDHQSQSKAILLEDPELAENACVPNVLSDDADARIHSGQSQANSDEAGNSLSASTNIPNLETQKIDEVNKFDPIWQHRPFCPWVAFTENKNLPGWKLTFQALVNEKSSPLTEAKDPILSIRKLFSSPPLNRLKGSE